MALNWDATSISPYDTCVDGLDPYLRWAEATDWLGMAQGADWHGAAGEPTQIVAKARDAADLQAILKKAEHKDSLLTIAPIYSCPIPGTQTHALHFTATVQRRNLQALRGWHPGLRWALSQPRRDAERAARASSLGRFGPQRPPGSFTVRNLLGAARPLAPPAAARSAAQGPDAVVAVIDFGCPFLSRRFATGPTALQTRLHAVWDQGGQVLAEDDSRLQDGAWPWTACTAMGYGRELCAPVLQGLFDAAQNPESEAFAKVDEGQAYRSIDALIDYEDARRRIHLATHGAHVLDVAGGHTDPLTGTCQDAAGKARLVFVQLPSLTASDSSGASLASHLLDGVRYVLSHCPEGTPVVINISYGSHAGPHDGLSLIEAAFDELLQERSDNFAIVLSSGNARGKACHARRRVHPRSSALLQAELAPGDTTDTFVETWYSPIASHELRVRVRSPSREWSPWVAPGQQQLQRSSGDGNAVVAMLRHELQVPQHDGARALVLLSMAPTQQPLGTPRALSTAGRWELEFALFPATEAMDGSGDAMVEIDARIERDDPGQNSGAGEHHFLDQDFHDELDTLSSLASGRHTLVAGGMRLNDRRQTEYTSVGPQRQRGSHALPLVLAACEEDEVHPNIAAAAVRSGEIYRMKGTSVAAPVLARLVLNRMVDKPVQREQWPGVLEQLVDSHRRLLRWPDAE